MGEVLPEHRELKSHSYCIHCGIVKNISPDRAKSRGYYTNMLARMPITKVQMRLIIKELESMDFDDAYSMTKSEQEKVFINIVQIYCKVSGAIKEEHLCRVMPNLN